MKITRKFYQKQYKLVAIIFSLFYAAQVKSQCTFNSTNGYTVTVEASPIELNKPSSNCSFGYNYSVDIATEVTFSGSNQPASLWNLQGTLYCGSTSLFFNRSNSPGKDTVVSAGSYRNVSDCATATPTSIGCDSIRIQISGPGISNTTAACPIPSPVPVEFISIKLHQHEGFKVLTWVTGSELNNHFFTVEMLNHNLEWVGIGEVMGNGTTQSIQEYSFIIPNNIQAKAFRIKQTDYDGTFDYSSVLVNDIEISDFKIYPNPVMDKLMLTGLKNRNTLIVIYNHLGYVQEEVNVKNYSLNNKSIDVSNLKPGLYILEVQGQRLKFIKE